MKIAQKEKNEIKKKIVASLQNEAEVQKIVIFGSFLTVETPNDIDVAVFQNSNESYLPLAMKYRKKTRMVSKRIPIDIIPMRIGSLEGSMADEIFRGEVIYEK